MLSGSYPSSVGNSWYSLGIDTLSCSWCYEVNRETLVCIRVIVHTKGDPWLGCVAKLFVCSSQLWVAILLSLACLQAEAGVSHFNKWQLNLPLNAFSYPSSLFSKLAVGFANTGEPVLFLVIYVKDRLCEFCMHFYLRIRFTLTAKAATISLSSHCCFESTFIHVSCQNA